MMTMEGRIAPIY